MESRHAGGRQHARQAGTGMGAGADQIQPVDVFAAVVRPEPGALRQHRLEPERGAAERQQPVLEILRRQQARGDDLAFQIGQQGAAEFAGDGAAIFFGRDAPVDAALQMRNRRQHVEGIAALGRQRRIGGGRAMQVQAEIVGQYLAFEDVGEQFPVARPQQDGVMRHVGIFASRAEIPDEQAHGISRALDPRGRSSATAPTPAADAGRSRPSRRWRPRYRRRWSSPDASRTPQAAPSLTMISRTSWLHRTRAALPFDQLHQPVDQTPGAAHGIPKKRAERIIISP